MGNKKIIFNRQTKLFEEKEDTPEDSIEKTNITKRERRLINWLPIIIAAITLILASVTILINSRQKELSERQAYIAESEHVLNERQFSSEKKPVFSISVDANDYYDSSKYRSEYRMWLFKNDIDNFFYWQYSNWLEGKFEYDFDPYEYLTEEQIFNNLLSVRDVWNFNRYIHDSETDKYFNGELKEAEVAVNDSVFWDAYIDNNQEKLSEITNGEYDNLKDEYSNYLLSLGYLSFDNWKSYYKYETQDIVMENIGANINNATLQVYIFQKYTVISDNIRYSFGIDTINSYLSEYYSGTFSDFLIDYDTQKKTFTLKFETTPQYQYDQYLGIKNIWGKANNKLNKYISENDIRITYIIDQPIYFYIAYFDIEGLEQRELYRYDPFEQTLKYILSIDPDIEEPNITEYDFMDLEYFSDYSSFISKCLGYSNSQYQTVEWFDDETYLILAEEKLITDIDSLFN